MSDNINENEQQVEEDNEPVSARRVEQLIDDEPDDIPEAPRREAKNAKELLLDELPARARKNSKLKGYLTGRIVIDILDKNDHYLFDWSENEAKCSIIKEMPKIKKSPDTDKELNTESGVDCILRLREQQLMLIQSGDLNPQLAIVNEKVKMEGHSGLGMYFFNLVYPKH